MFWGEKKKSYWTATGRKKIESREERARKPLVAGSVERWGEMGGPWGGGVLSLGRRVCSGCAMQFLLSYHLCLYPATLSPKYSLHICCFHCHQVRLVLLLRWSCFIWVTCKMTSNICLLIHGINKAIHVELFDTQHPEHLLSTCHYSVRWQWSNKQAGIVLALWVLTRGFLIFLFLISGGMSD